MTYPVPCEIRNPPYCIHSGRLVKISDINSELSMSVPGVNELQEIGVPNSEPTRIQFVIVCPNPLPSKV
jgi:hypothetical protein